MLPSSPLCGPRSGRSSGEPREAGNGLPLLSCDKGELRVYYHSSSQRERERGQQAQLAWAEEAARGRGCGRPGQSRCPPRPHPTGCTQERFPRSSRFSARRTLCSWPTEVHGEVATVLVGKGHRVAARMGSCATSARAPGSPRLAQESIGAYRDQGDAQKMREDSIPR